MPMRSIDEFNRSQRQKESYESSPFMRVRVCLWVLVAVLLPGIADWIGCVFIAIFQGAFGTESEFREALANISWESFSGFYVKVWEVIQLLFG